MYDPQICKVLKDRTALAEEKLRLREGSTHPSRLQLCSHDVTTTARAGWPPNTYLHTPGLPHPLPIRKQRWAGSPDFFFVCADNTKSFVSSKGCSCSPVPELWSKLRARRWRCYLALWLPVLVVATRNNWWMRGNGRKLEETAAKEKGVQEKESFAWSRQEGVGLSKKHLCLREMLLISPRLMRVPRGAQ